MDPFTGDYDEPRKPQKPQKSHKTLWTVLGLVIGLLVLGGLGYLIYRLVSKDKAPVANAVSSNRLSMHSNGSGGRTDYGARDSYANGCYAPPATYNAAQDLEPVDQGLVPPYQAAVQNLPAMQKAHMQEEYPGTGIGPSTREGIDPISNSTFDSTTFGPDEDYQERVKQTEGVGVSAIYSRGDKKGISMINQKSRMVDPTKMVPQVDPSRQSERMVQAGPSIEDIGCRVPKAADIMRLLRASRGNALSHQIPRDKPPIYTEGLNAFRQTPLPQSTGDTGCTIGISPYEVSDLIDYTPNPFLQRSRSTEIGYNYSP